MTEQKQPTIAEMRRACVKPSLEKRLRLNKLISANIGKDAEVILQPKTPVSTIQQLNEDHKILVDVGYIKNIVILEDERTKK